MKRNLVRRVMILLLTVCCVSAGDAQREKMTSLESELQTLSGSARVVKYIELADAAAEAGELKKAAEYADAGEALAQRLKMPALRAAALNREGWALLRMEKKGLFGKNKSAHKFELSNRVLRDARIEDRALILSNLAALKTLAEKAGSAAEAAAIEGDIQRISSGGAVWGSSKAAAPVEPVQSPAASPPAPLASSPPPVSFRSAPRVSAAQEAKLQELLAEKEQEISAMSEEQAKAALKLAQQTRMLDSMTFKAELADYILKNQELNILQAKSDRNFLLTLSAALLFLFGGSLFGFFKARQYNRQIRFEQERSENLLLNILPALVARELKTQGYAAPEYHEDVAVLFADFVGFSKIAEQMSPQDLIKDLDTCFRAFDKIVQEFGLEKIKTIGDAYMCVGGLHDRKSDYTLQMVKAAKSMQEWLHEWNYEREGRGAPRFDARIGIHNGPVIAGVVGSKKFAFDIWGDTVNIASRVESAGEGGRVNISEATFARLKSKLQCLHRGQIEVKNKGQLGMYFVL
ncbi:MAG: adenylate/guanylate cyclase domain-containing protein [Saprospiraceae bacterium]